jgi:O-acetylhomoserine (thiol)-lyase
MKDPGFSTRAIHESGRKGAIRALRFPVYAGVAFDFESAESMADCFLGRNLDFAYSRISNPTVDAFERRMTALEDGYASVAVSSGMAAISTALHNLVQEGDNIVAGSSLFGGTYSLFTNVLAPLGVGTRFVPIDDLERIEAAMDERTRAVFFETISNPSILVPDFAAISAIAREKRVPLIADSTVTTPYLFDSKGFGVNLVIHSTTKYISGGATSMGGVIVDLGNFDWSSIPSLRAFHRFNEHAFVARLRKEVYREMGSCLSPHDAYFQTLGLETLSLRMERICRNAQAVAEFLQDRKEVQNVSYSGLLSSPYHELATRQFRGLHGGVLSFRLPDREAAYQFLNRLSLIKRATNLGDNRSLATHPASTIFANIPVDEVAALGVDDGLVRLSIGIEDVDDLIGDITGALEGVRGHERATGRTL